MNRWASTSDCKNGKKKKIQTVHLRDKQNMLISSAVLSLIPRCPALVTRKTEAQRHKQSSWPLHGFFISKEAALAQVLGQRDRALQRRTGTVITSALVYVHWKTPLTELMLLFTWNSDPYIPLEFLCQRQIKSCMVQGHCCEHSRTGGTLGRTLKLRFCLTCCLFQGKQEENLISSHEKKVCVFLAHILLQCIWCGGNIWLSN